MNQISKGVCSNRLKKTPWGETEIIRGDLALGIQRPKAQDGKDIYAHEGAGFAKSLIATGLIDEYHLVIHPVTIGQGLSICSGIDREFALLESKRFSNGAVANIYRPI